MTEKLWRNVQQKTELLPAAAIPRKTQNRNNVKTFVEFDSKDFAVLACIVLTQCHCDRQTNTHLCDS